MFHEYMAKLCVDYPGKFGAFAVPTLPDVEGAIEEARYYALDIWGLDGVGMLSNYRKKRKETKTKRNMAAFISTCLSTTEVRVFCLLFR